MYPVNYNQFHRESKVTENKNSIFRSAFLKLGESILDYSDHQNYKGNRFIRMSIKIALLADLCGKNAEALYREFAEIVFLRTLHYLNSQIQPDAVVLTGSAEKLTEKQLAAVREASAEFKMPFLSMTPGIKGLPSPVECGEFLLSDHIKDCNCARKPIYLHNGGETISSDTLAVLETHHCPLCIAEPECNVPSFDRGVMVVHAPPLCEPPYRFAVIEVADSGEVTVQYEQYRLPPGLMDSHVHTQMAYCSENMDLISSLRLAKLWGLEKIAFTEHSGHLYFKREQYWGENKIWYQEGLDCADRTVRTEEYLELFAEVERESCYLGMELDVDRRGRFVATQDVLNRLELKVGAVHALSEESAPETKDGQFFFVVKSLIESGIDILAHPFRIYSWDGVGEKPVGLFEPIVELLKKHNVAAEVNFHHNRPDPVFTKMCIDAGVKIALGSDAHNLYEVGFFQPHLKFLREAGYTGELKDILFRKD